MNQRESDRSDHVRALAFPRKPERAAPFRSGFPARAALLLMLLVAVVGPHASAQEHEDYDAYKVRIALDWFYSQPEGHFSGENGSGTFDLTKDVSFNSYSTPAGEFDWKFTRQNHFYLLTLDFDQAKTFTASRTIVFRGQTFSAGSTIISDLRSRFLAPGYQYDVIRRKKWNLGIQLQLNIMDVRGSLNAAAQINNGVPQNAAFSSASIRVPLPLAGPKIRFYPTRRLFVTANVLGMYFFGYGDFLSSQGTVGFKLTNNIAVRGGYQLASRFNINTKAQQVGLSLTQRGAIAGLELSF